MIGIFDSGSGGLTVLKEIRARMPQADIVYFGDIKNAPYGTRSLEELTALTVAAIELLEKRGAQSIVSACNSVSAAIAASLADKLPKQLVEMVGPTVNAFKDSHTRVLLAATPATIESEIYQNGFKMIGKDIATVAIPELAGAIEFGNSDAELEAIIRKALAEVDVNSYDTLVLGCTHYPFAKHLFKKVAPDLAVVDPAVAVAEQVKGQMEEEEQGSGTTRLIISKESEHFRSRVQEMVGQGEAGIEVL